MGKYLRLQDHLEASRHRVEMGFDEIAKLVDGLPPTAFRRPEWWSNNRDHHVQAAVWLDAGRRVEHVDLGRRRVRFS